MKRQFWNWVRNEDGTRTLSLDGVIAEESWFDDDVTPKAFKEQLNAGTGDVVVWINCTNKCLDFYKYFCVILGCVS